MQEFSAKKAVVLLSGGMDSAVVLLTALKRCKTVACLSIDYGSKHSQRELAAANKLAEFYKVERTVINFKFINDLFQSSLLQSGEEIPDGYYEEQNMRSTVVPFRNGIFLSAAVGFAESIAAELVLIGSHAGDREVYPDCRKAFTEAFSEAAKLGTYANVKVEAPLSEMTKLEVAKLGRDLGLDFSLTWTCYRGGEKHCGRCASCNSRKEALGFSEGRDPTVYE